MSGVGSRIDLRERVVGVGLVALLLLATFGEGGGSAESMLRWHAWLVAVVLWALVVAPFSSRSVPAPPHAPLLPFALSPLLAAAGAARAPSATPRTSPSWNWPRPPRSCSSPPAWAVAGFAG